MFKMPPYLTGSGDGLHVLLTIHDNADQALLPPAASGCSQDHLNPAAESAAMNKADLIAAIADATDQTKDAVGRTIEKALITIATALARGEEVTQRWPGLFGQGGAFFRWVLCRLPWCAISWASLQSGYALPPGRPGNGGEIYAAARCGVF